MKLRKRKSNSFGKKNKKVPSLRKALVGGVAVAVLGMGFWASKAFYTVASVIDGDTFVTTEKQYIRLDSVNAPENESCLARESKDALSKLVLGKKVFLKVTYINGMRLIANVYTVQGNVGEIMLSKGMATFADKGTQTGNGLLKTANEAKSKKLGVYSTTCSQLTNPINPKCDIKGNTTGSKNFYHYPGCNGYDQTIVELHTGDRWFCSEAEAKKAGFIKGGDCR